MEAPLDPLYVDPATTKGKGKKKQLGPTYYNTAQASQYNTGYTGPHTISYRIYDLCLIQKLH